MACKVTAGLLKDCNFFVGSAKRIWIANMSELSGGSGTVAITDANADGILDTISMSGSAKFYEFEFEKNSGFFTNELAINGVQKSVKHGVGWQLAKLDVNVIAQAQNLALGTFVAIVETRSGVKVVLGRNNGLVASTAGLSSGVQETDFGGLTVVLDNLQLEYAPEFIGTIPV